jgi:hypothetical protein
VIRTLAVNGFVVSRVARRAFGMYVDCERIDLFGNAIPYRIFLAERDLSKAEIAAAARNANREGFSPVLIGGDSLGKMTAFRIGSFQARLGGPVPSLLPLLADYGARLETLGSNARVTGLSGDPEDLYEEHVYAGLQFVLNSRVVRYGNQYTGTVLPDGAAIVGGRPLLMYDAKAASGAGYSVTRNTIRQFADYVTHFHRSYEAFLGRLHAFLVVSSDFRSNSNKSARSAELIAECGVPLVYMRSATLAHLVSRMAHRPVLRNILRWPEVFTPPEITKLAIDKAIRSVDRERIATD